MLNSVEQHFYEMFANGIEKINRKYGTDYEFGYVAQIQYGMHVIQWRFIDRNGNVIFKTFEPAMVLGFTWLLKLQSKVLFE